MLSKTLASASSWYLHYWDLDRHPAPAARAAFLQLTDPRDPTSVIEICTFCGARASAELTGSTTATVGELSRGTRSLVDDAFLRKSISILSKLGCSIEIEHQLINTNLAL